MPSHHYFEENVFSDDGMSDYSCPWSSEMEDPKEEDDADAEDDDDDSDFDDSDSDFTSPPPKRER